LRPRRPHPRRRRRFPRRPRWCTPARSELAGAGGRIEYSE
jgi:hypothetical protein